MIFSRTVICICAVLLLIGAKSKEEDGKLCRIREGLYTRIISDYFFGFYCYNYTNDYRLYFKYNYTGEKYDGVMIPVMKTEDGNFPYHYQNATSVEYIRKSFKTEHFFQMWFDCLDEAADCCDNHMDNSTLFPTEEYPCPAIWDGWTCFSPEKANTVQTQVCSSQAFSTDSEVCELMSEKTCFANGTWNQKTDVTHCILAPILRSRHYYNVIMLAVATVLTFPAVVIFCSLRFFRQNLRYVLHRNLVLVIVLRNLLTITTKQIIILDALKSPSESNNVMNDNSAGCRVLAFFENAAKNGMFACMLADGFYLHKLIVRPFANDPSQLFIYATVLVLSFLPSITWALVRDAHGGTDCWMVDDTADQWIVDGFRIAIIVVNFALLFDIIRVMVMKLKSGSVTKQARSTLRATLFLIPLFGLHIVIITNRNMVPGKSCGAEDIYYYLSYSIEGLQGPMVATLFCYINGEVRGELKNAFRKFALYLETRFDIHISREKKSRRRTTAATYVGY